MPFIESQPININDLVIESLQQQTSTLLPDIFEFFNVGDSEIAEMKKERFLMRERKLLFGDDANIHAEEIEKRLGVYGEPIDRLITIGLGRDPLLKPFIERFTTTVLEEAAKKLFANMEDRIPIEYSEVSTDLHWMADAHLFMPSLKPTDEWIENLLKTKEKFSRRGYYLKFLSGLKLLGVEYNLTQEDIRLCLKEISDARNDELTYETEILEYAAYAKILNCDKISSGENGIELITYPKSNLNPTPPLPEVRNF